MTNLPGKIERTVGNTFGLRTWIEYGFKQAQDELGWADERLTEAGSIERWWELVMCAYLLVSLQASVFAPAGSPADAADVPATPNEPLPPAPHSAWTDEASWNQRLPTLQLLLQPFVYASLLLPWLHRSPLPHLSAGLADLCALLTVLVTATPANQHERHVAARYRYHRPGTGATRRQCARRRWSGGSGTV